MINNITKKQTKNLKLSDNVVTNVELIADESMSLSSKNVVENCAITSAMIDIQKTNNCFYYTAFDVFATDKVVPAGTKDTKEELSVLFDDIATNSECLFTGLEYSEDAPAGMTQCFEFYVPTHIEKSQSDIVIDWGDGTTLSVKTAELIDESTYEKTSSDKYILSGESGLVCYNKRSDRTFVVCVHTYSRPNKYKVTITGNDYYMIRGSDDTLEIDWTGLSKNFEDIDSPEKIYNLICTAFYNKDGYVRPLNHNVNNVSSCLKSAKKLLQMNTQNLQLHLRNCQSLCSFAYNLKHAYFSPDFFAYITGAAYIKYPFNGDRNLEYVDLYLPELKLDYSSPDNKQNACLFQGCDKIIDKFSAFILKSDGTAKQLHVNTSDFIFDGEYTAFEVFPTNKEIPAGYFDNKFIELDSLPEIDNTIYKKYKDYIVKNNSKYYRPIEINDNDVITYQWEETTDCSVSELLEFENTFPTNLKYTVAVPAQDTLCIRSYLTAKRKDCNVIIDWGDGTITHVKDNLTHVSYTEYDPIIYGYSQFIAIHKYTGEYVNRKNIVKVYGDSITMIRTMGSFNGISYKSIISRLFSADLPIHSNVTNISSICNNSLRLLKIDMSYTYSLKNITNMANAFTVCTNLLEVIWNEYAVTSMSANVTSMFNSCKNLHNVDGFSLPITAIGNDMSGTFNECSSLTCDILGLLPTQFIQNAKGFQNANGLIKINELFRKCNLLTCSNYKKLGKILWNSDIHEFIGAGLNFLACSDEFRMNVSPAWGGLMFDPNCGLTFSNTNVAINNIFNCYDSTTITAGSAVINKDNLNMSDYRTFVLQVNKGVKLSFDETSLNVTYLNDAKAKLEDIGKAYPQVSFYKFNFTIKDDNSIILDI